MADPPSTLPVNTVGFGFGGGHMQPGDGPPQIGNNMRFAVGALLLFPPFAVAAIRQAARVGPLVAAGDYAAAQVAAAAAKKWWKLAVIAGIVAWGGVVCCIGAFFLGLFLVSKNGP
jgi:hypothetical protein